MFIGVILYAIGVFLAVKWAFGGSKDILISNSSSSTTMIGDGKQHGKERAEKLNKERATDPMATQANNSPAANNAYSSQPRLPDMRGADYGNLNGDAMNNPSVLKGMAMLGVSPALIAGEMATKVAKKVGTKVDEKFEIKKKISKPIQWGKDKIYTAKTAVNTAKTAIGNKKDEFIDSKVKPKIRKVTSDINKFIEPAKNMTRKIQGQIERGKDKLSIVGEQITDTEGYRIGAQGARMIRGAITGKDIFANRFFAPKGTSARLYQNMGNTNIQNSQLKNNRWYLSEGQQPLISRENVPNKVTININTLNLMNNGNRKYSVAPENMPKILSLEEAFSDPENRELNRTQLGISAGVYRAINGLAVSGNSGYQTFSQVMQSDSKNYEKVLRQVIKEQPGIKNPEQVMWIASRAMQLNEDKKHNREVNASLMTNRRNVQRDLEAGNLNYLNGMIRNDSAISNQFENFVETSYKKDMEEKARANIEKRSNMSLDEKEKEYEQELKKLLENGSEEDKKAVEERIKQQVLAEPEVAIEIIGEKGVDELTEHIKKEYERVYKHNLSKQENIADNEFRKANDEYKDSSPSEVREARIKFEMKESIEQATSEMYSKMQQESEENQKRDQKIRSFEGYMERRRRQEEQYQKNVEGSMPKAVGSDSIYVPRYVQEQRAKIDNNLD